MSALTDDERIALVEKALEGLDNNSKWDIINSVVRASVEQDNDGQYIIYTGIYDDPEKDA